MQCPVCAEQIKDRSRYHDIEHSITCPTSWRRSPVRHSTFFYINSWRIRCTKLTINGLYSGLVCIVINFYSHKFFKLRHLYFSVCPKPVLNRSSYFFLRRARSVCSCYVMFPLTLGGSIHGTIARAKRGSEESGRPTTICICTLWQNGNLGTQSQRPPLPWPSIE
jgi:hypothetical protein